MREFLTCGSGQSSQDTSLDKLLVILLQSSIPYETAPFSTLRNALHFPLQRGNGIAEVEFTLNGGKSRLSHLYQKAPCHILLPDPPPNDLITAVVATISGGITGGDRIRIDLATREGSSALVTTQAAEKVYRSLGEECAIEIKVQADAGSWIEWMPQETILFDNARFRRITTIEVNPGARVVAGEILMFGRVAHGELFRNGFLHDSWRILRKGQLIWMDTLRLEGDVAAELNCPAGFDGAVSAATLVYVADESDSQSQLEIVRSLLSGNRTRSGATCVNGVLVVRFLSDDLQLLKNEFGLFWLRFRKLANGLPSCLPRVWNC